MLSEFSGVQGQFQVLCEERSNLLDTLRQLENGAQLNHQTISKSKRLRIEEVSDEEEVHFFDTNEYFSEPIPDSGSISVDCVRLESQTDSMYKEVAKQNLTDSGCCVERRKKLPDPVEKEKCVSLWSMIKDNIGKDLTRVCLPVYFNEPISSLPKCFEDLEYSHLLDQAYEHGKAGNSLMMIFNSTRPG